MHFIDGLAGIQLKRDPDGKRRFRGQIDVHSLFKILAFRKGELPALYQGVPRVNIERIEFGLFFQRCHTVYKKNALM